MAPTATATRTDELRDRYRQVVQLFSAARAGLPSEVADELEGQLRTLGDTLSVPYADVADPQGSETDTASDRLPARAPTLDEVRDRLNALDREDGEEDLRRLYRWVEHRRLEGQRVTSTVADIEREMDFVAEEMGLDPDTLRETARRNYRPPEGYADAVPEGARWPFFWVSLAISREQWPPDPRRGDDYSDTQMREEVESGVFALPVRTAYERWLVARFKEAAGEKGFPSKAYRAPRAWDPSKAYSTQAKMLRTDLDEGIGGRKVEPTPEAVREATEEKVFGPIVEEVGRLNWLIEHPEAYGEDTDPTDAWDLLTEMKDMGGASSTTDLVKKILYEVHGITLGRTSFGGGRTSYPPYGRQADYDKEIPTVHDLWTGRAEIGFDEALSRRRDYEEAIREAKREASEARLDRFVEGLKERVFPFFAWYVGNGWSTTHLATMSKKWDEYWDDRDRSPLLRRDPVSNTITVEGDGMGLRWRAPDADTPEKEVQGLVFYVGHARRRLALAEELDEIRWSHLTGAARTDAQSSLENGEDPEKLYEAVEQLIIDQDLKEQTVPEGVEGADEQDSSEVQPVGADAEDLPDPRPPIPDVGADTPMDWLDAQVGDVMFLAEDTYVQVVAKGIEERRTASQLAARMGQVLDGSYSTRERDDTGTHQVLRNLHPTNAEDEALIERAEAKYAGEVRREDEPKDAGTDERTYAGHIGPIAAEVREARTGNLTDLVEQIALSRGYSAGIDATTVDTEIRPSVLDWAASEDAEKAVPDSVASVAELLSYWADEHLAEHAPTSRRVEIARRFDELVENHSEAVRAEGAGAETDRTVFQRAVARALIDLVAERNTMTISPRDLGLNAVGKGVTATEEVDPSQGGDSPPTYQVEQYWIDANLGPPTHHIKPGMGLEEVLRAAADYTPDAGDPYEDWMDAWRTPEHLLEELPDYLKQKAENRDDLREQIGQAEEYVQRWKDNSPVTPTFYNQVEKWAKNQLAGYIFILEAFRLMKDDGGGRTAWAMPEIFEQMRAFTGFVAQMRGHVQDLFEEPANRLDAMREQLEAIKESAKAPVIRTTDDYAELYEEQLGEEPPRTSAGNLTPHQIRKGIDEVRAIIPPASELAQDATEPAFNTDTIDPQSGWSSSTDRTQELGGEEFYVGRREAMLWATEAQTGVFTDGHTFLFPPYAETAHDAVREELYRRARLKSSVYRREGMSKEEASTRARERVEALADHGNPPNWQSVVPETTERELKYEALAAPGGEAAVRTAGLFTAGTRTVYVDADKLRWLTEHLGVSLGSDRLRFAQPEGEGMAVMVFLEGGTVDIDGYVAPSIEQDAPMVGLIMPVQAQPGWPIPPDSFDTEGAARGFSYEPHVARTTEELDEVYEEQAGEPIPRTKAGNLTTVRLRDALYDLITVVGGAEGETHVYIPPKSALAGDVFRPTRRAMKTVDNDLRPRMGFGLLPGDDSKRDYDRAVWTNGHFLIWGEAARSLAEEGRERFVREAGHKRNRKEGETKKEARERGREELEEKLSKVYPNAKAITPDERGERLDFAGYMNHPKEEAPVAAYFFRTESREPVKVDGDYLQAFERHAPIEELRFTQTRPERAIQVWDPEDPTVRVGLIMPILETEAIDTTYPPEIEERLRGERRENPQNETLMGRWPARSEPLLIEAPRENAATGDPRDAVLGETWGAVGTASLVSTSEAARSYESAVMFANASLDQLLIVPRNYVSEAPEAPGRARRAAAQFLGYEPKGALEFSIPNRVPAYLGYAETLHYSSRKMIREGDEGEPHPYTHEFDRNRHPVFEIGPALIIGEDPTCAPEEKGGHCASDLEITSAGVLN